MNPELKLVFVHCIIRQEVLCESMLKKINHVVDVTKIVNFIRVKSNESQTSSQYHCCFFYSAHKNENFPHIQRYSHIMLVFFCM